MQHYFVDKINDSFILKDNDFHHVKNVMRIKNMQEIVCIYDSRKYLCQIEYVASSYQIHVLHELKNSTELNKDIILYQALIKNDKFDFVIQKATELGVSKIVPTICKRSIIKVDKNNSLNKINRYQKIIKEASEQSTRSIQPTIDNFIDLKDIELDKDTLGLVAYEKDDDMKSLHNELTSLNEYQKVAIVIGPEGGFEKDEVELLIKKGFHVVSLGNRILRSETASLASIAIIAHYIESFGE